MKDHNLLFKISIIRWNVLLIIRFIRSKKNWFNLLFNVRYIPRIILGEWKSFHWQSQEIGTLWKKDSVTIIKSVTFAMKNLSFSARNHTLYDQHIYKDETIQPERWVSRTISSQSRKVWRIINGFRDSRMSESFRGVLELGVKRGRITSLFCFTFFGK